MIEGISAWNVFLFEYVDGRFCAANLRDIMIWKLDTSAIKLWSSDSALCELTMTGHTSRASCIIYSYLMEDYVLRDNTISLNRYINWCEVKNTL